MDYLRGLRTKACHTKRIIMVFSPLGCLFIKFYQFHVTFMANTKMVLLGVWEKMTTSGGKWCEYYKFGAVLACLNAVAAPGTILHLETPKKQHFSYFNGISVISTKMMVL